MAKNYYKLPGPVRDMTAPELRHYLGGKKNSVILRTIILNEKEHLDVAYNRSLRGFWYRTVKPALEKLGLLSDELQEDSITKWDSELSRYMAELVRMGGLTYQDLNIVDGSRQRAAPSEGYHSTSIKTYGYKVNIAPYPNFIFCTEKDTAYSILRDLASLFGCSCISGKGHNSLAAMEDLLRDIARQAGNKAPVYILTLTDYDPSGYYIAETFKNQAEGLLGSLNLENEIRVKRIGITPDQLSPEEVEANKYSPKRANLSKWVKATGGINGEPKGLELDALPPDRIRELFIKNIEPFIDPEHYKEFIRPAYVHKLFLEAIQGKIQEMGEQIAIEFMGDVQIKDFNLWGLARDEYSYLPVGDLCQTDAEEQIKQRALSYFRL